MFAAAHCMIALIFARTVTWEGQRRDGYRLSWTSAGKAFWQPTVFGAALLGILYVAAPGAIPWFVPFLMGLILAIPFAVFSSMPAIGAVAARWKLCGIPEEITGAPEINAVMPLLSPR
jgi:membrane glycosyltransferase